MPRDPKRIVEVRLIVLVTVALADPDLIEALAASRGKSVVEIVSSEVESNLESVSYVETVVVRPL